jgi:hypothetical protein
MSNAAGRLLGTLGSGVLYSYVGSYEGVYQGTDGRLGLAACMVAGTVSSVVAAGITTRINDQGAGLMCGKKVIVKEEIDWEMREKEGEVEMKETDSESVI